MPCSHQWVASTSFLLLSQRLEVRHQKGSLLPSWRLPRAYLQLRKAALEAGGEAGALVLGLAQAGLQAGDGGGQRLVLCGQRVDAGDGLVQLLVVAADGGLQVAVYLRRRGEEGCRERS